MSDAFFSSEMDEHRSRKGNSLRWIFFILFITITVFIIVSINSLVDGYQNHQKRSAVFKDVISTLSNIQAEGMRTNRLTQANFSSYFLGRLITSRECVNNALKEGCWISTQGSAQDWFDQVPAEEAEPGLIMMNGASITGFTPHGQYENSLFIDWNGVAGPNKVGQDQLYVDMCFGDEDCQGQTPGTIIPALGIKGRGIEANQKLFYEIVTRH